MAMHWNVGRDAPPSSTPPPMTLEHAVYRVKRSVIPVSQLSAT